MKPNVRFRSASRWRSGRSSIRSPVEPDRARVGRVEQAEDVQQRALARPARPDDRDELAVLDLEVDPAEHRDLVLPLAVALRQPDRREVARHRPRLPW